MGARRVAGADGHHHNAPSPWRDGRLAQDAAHTGGPHTRGAAPLAQRRVMGRPFGTASPRPPAATPRRHQRCQCRCHPALACGTGRSREERRSYATSMVSRPPGHPLLAIPRTHEGGDGPRSATNEWRSANGIACQVVQRHQCAADALSRVLMLHSAFPSFTPTRVGEPTCTTSLSIVPPSAVLPDRSGRAAFAQSPLHDQALDLCRPRTVPCAQ